MVVSLSGLETNGSLKLSGLHVESAFDYVFFPIQGTIWDYNGIDGPGGVVSEM